MSSRIFLAAALVLSSALAQGRAPDLKLPSFAHLQGKAIRSADVTIGPFPLRLVSGLLDDRDPQTAAARRTLEGLSLVRVRSYEFASDYEYSKEDIEGVRKQLAGKGWHKLVHVHNRKENEQVDVYLAMAGDKPGGLAVVASCPREFVIVHIVGSIELDDLAVVQEQLGINDSRLARLHTLRQR